LGDTIFTFLIHIFDLNQPSLDLHSCWLSSGDRYPFEISYTFFTTS